MGYREIIIIAIVVILLFGAPKLPELARSLGKSMKILKEETKSLSDSDKKDAATDDKGTTNASSADGGEGSAESSSDDDKRGK
ncbi:Sec-independent protein translocase subunit TatA [Demequina sp. B12]|uniref:Sec-independent protein translocase subunit TatA n=1 Tax=Demequina sp. B12 TaxID=2992757 RepID=UPI00237A59DF|nr:Sec-independent protein translocase subunit TatA [Demequina sp. B12]MDE0573078.1 Sec-independent protein translocase subunit TatA [Demequina sp. B12]